MTDFKQNDFSQDRDFIPKHHKDVLVGSFCRLEYKTLKNYYSQIVGLKQNAGAKKTVDDFNKAKERIKQQIIISDKTQDNSLVYTAMTQFKKRKE